MEIIFVIFVIALLALVVRLVVGEIIFNKHKVQPWKPLVVARQLKSNRGVNNSDLAWYVKEYASHHGTQTLKVIHENRRSMKVAIPKGGRFSISFWSISSDVDPVLHVKTYWTGKQTASQKTAQYTYWQVLSILERPTTTETKQMERRKMTRELRQ
ncbi:MAG: hypothetical protein FWC69_06190, partial [Defluviitaleaceae bacterium]|nr:hypothetical protein [Defluviitaleaceae bacterium]